MRKYLLLLPALTLAACGTATQYRPPNLGPPRGEAHSIKTAQRYRPKHGNSEHANHYSASGCGVERWAVKTMTDPAANQVNLTPQPTSVADLTSIAPPVAPTDRTGPTETQTFSLSATLTFIKQESDSDYHLVLEDAQHNHMIVESTSPNCAQGSLVIHEIEEVRSQIDHQGGTSTPLPTPVAVTGVGFFDRLHGQTGVAPNGIELHPLLSISFGQR